MCPCRSRFPLQRRPQLLQGGCAARCVWFPAPPLLPQSPKELSRCHWLPLQQQRRRHIPCSPCTCRCSRFLLLSRMLLLGGCKRAQVLQGAVAAGQLLRCPVAATAAAVGCGWLQSFQQVWPDIHHSRQRRQQGASGG